MWGNDKARLEVKSVWSNLAKYQKLAKEAGEIHKVFVGSMMDIFEKPMPMIDSKGEQKMVMSFGQPVRPIFTDQLRDALFSFISEGKYPNLLFLLLTKRPSNINKYIPEAWKTSPPDNVMFGTSPVNQETADKLIPQLYEVQGKRFLSIEPQLGDIDLAKEYPVGKGSVAMGLLMDWVIQGGESGHHRRPFNLDWAYHTREQCKLTGVPYFFKQIDKVIAPPSDLILSRQFPVYEPAI